MLMCDIADYPGQQEFQIVRSRTLYFSSGDTVGDVRCATVDIYDDTKVENDEFFNFYVYNGGSTQVTRGNNWIITILENDGSY